MHLTDAIEAGVAPRSAEAWAKVHEVLADLDWHSYDELVDVVVDTGLTPQTANNLLRAARQAGWVTKDTRGRGDSWYRLESDRGGI